MLKADATSADLTLNRVCSSFSSVRFTTAVSAHTTTFLNFTYILQRCMYMNSMDAAITKKRIHDRPCQALPDIGNPVYVAGLCWWRDNAVLKNDHGFLHSIRKSKAPGTYGFGDHAQKPAEFRLHQVPLWYAASYKEGPVLVFANNSIITNKCRVACRQAGSRCSQRAR